LICTPSFSAGLDRIIDGEVIDQRGAPVPGAKVVSVSDTGESIAGTRTDETGRFQVRAGDPGRAASLRITRVGFLEENVTVCDLPTCTMRITSGPRTTVRMEKGPLDSHQMVLSESAVRALDDSA
jgi:hypothetical protein